MRLVLDTNTAISGLLWSGPPRTMIDAAISGTVLLFSSQALLTELADVLARPKLAARLVRIGRTPSELADGYARLVTLVEPVLLPSAVSRDPDDDAVLACALAAAAEVIISGDDDLLTLGSYADVPILTAAAFVLRLDLR